MDDLTLTGDTGSGDKDSVWGSDLLTWTESLGGLAGTIISALNKNKANDALAKAKLASATNSSKIPKWIVYAGIGLGTLIVLVLLLKK